MAKLTFPDISNHVHDQLITYARSHKVERRLNLRAQIILDWKNRLIYKTSSEKTQIQALDRTQPVLPLRPGAPRRLKTTCKRNGTVNLMAAHAVKTGEVTAREVDRNNSENFLKFLAF